VRWSSSSCTSTPSVGAPKYRKPKDHLPRGRSVGDGTAGDGRAANCGAVAVDSQPERRGVALGPEAQRQLAFAVLDVVPDDGHLW